MLKKKQKVCAEDTECREHRMRLVEENARLRDALETLDVVLSEHGIVNVVSARMIIEKALGIHEKRTAERRAQKE